MVSLMALFFNAGTQHFHWIVAVTGSQGCNAALGGKTEHDTCQTSRGFRKIVRTIGHAASDINMLAVPCLVMLATIFRHLELGFAFHGATVVFVATLIAVAIPVVGFATGWLVVPPFAGIFLATKISATISSTFRPCFGTFAIYFALQHFSLILLSRLAGLEPG